MEWGWRRFYSIIEFGVKNGVGLEMPLVTSMVQNKGCFLIPSYPFEGIPMKHWDVVSIFGDP